MARIKNGKTSRLPDVFGEKGGGERSIDQFEEGPPIFG